MTVNSDSKVSSDISPAITTRVVDERRRYKNVSIYITELPPTPWRYQGKLIVTLPPQPSPPYLVEAALEPVVIHIAARPGSHSVLRDIQPIQLAARPGSHSTLLEGQRGRSRNGQQDTSKQPVADARTWGTRPQYKTGTSAHPPLYPAVNSLIQPNSGQLDKSTQQSGQSSTSGLVIQLVGDYHLSWLVLVLFLEDVFPGHKVEKLRVCPLVPMRE